MREEFEEELEAAQEAEADDPSFAKEETAEDVDILTDGGEDGEADES